MCSDAATVTANSLMTCPDACYQAPRSRVPLPSVVVLDVVGSNPIAHPQYSRTSGDPRCPCGGCLASPMSDFGSELSDFGSRPRRGRRSWQGADSQVPECRRLMADHQAWLPSRKEPPT